MSWKMRWWIWVFIARLQMALIFPRWRWWVGRWLKGPIKVYTLVNLGRVVAGDLSAIPSTGAQSADANKGANGNGMVGTAAGAGLKPAPTEEGNDGNADVLQTFHNTWVEMMMREINP